MLKTRPAAAGLGLQHTGQNSVWSKSRNCRYDTRSILKRDMDLSDFLSNQIGREVILQSKDTTELLINFKVN